MAKQERKAKEIGKVDGLGTIYQISAPLDKQIQAFEKVGISAPYLATPEQVAQIRLAGVLESNFSRTSMAPVVAKGEHPILYKPSLLMDFEKALIAVGTYKQGRYPTFDRSFYDLLKEKAYNEQNLEPEDRKAQMLQSARDYRLTPEMEDTRFILGKQTSEYFYRFNFHTLEFHNFLPPPELPKEKCVVNSLRFGRPDYGSVLVAKDKDLHLNCGAVGIAINP